MTLRSFVVTDLTRMQGHRVCIAGYTVTSMVPDVCVRPELVRGQLNESWLYATGTVVRPFSRLQLDLSHPESDPPHTEDWKVRNEYALLEPLVSEADRWALLTAIDDGSVSSIYGDGLRRDPFPHVVAGVGARSLGTVFPTTVQSIDYRLQVDTGRWRYRLRFEDAAGLIYELPVTDLNLRTYLDHLRLVNGLSPDQIVDRLGSAFRAAKSVVLRIGLARPRSNDHDRRCSLQVNGIYTEPDYLDGRCFADFIERTDPLAGVPDAPF